MVDIKFTDNSKKILEKEKQAKEKALWAIGATAEAHAKKVLTKEVYTGDKDYPLTGRLRNSVTHAETNQAAYVGTNVKYAPGIELGTHRKAGAVHFIKKGATEPQEKFKALTKQAFENA